MGLVTRNPIPDLALERVTQSLCPSPVTFRMVLNVIVANCVNRPNVPQYFCDWVCKSIVRLKYIVGVLHNKHWPDQKGRV